jgi:hypothetical protein
MPLQDDVLYVGVLLSSIAAGRQLHVQSSLSDLISEEPETFGAFFTDCLE